MTLRGYLHSLALTLVVGGTLSLVGACGDDGGSSGRVPFKQDDPAGRSGETPVDTPVGVSPPTVFQPVDGRSLETGQQVAPVGDNTVTISAGSIRAVAEIDLNGDSKPDALMVVETADGGLEVGHATRVEEGFGNYRKNVDLATGFAGCAVSEVKLRVHTRELGVVDAKRTCPGEALDSPTRVFAVISTDTSPRVVKKLAVLPQGDRASGQLSIEVDIEDFDSDGHSDLELALLVNGLRSPIRWINRPGGLGRVREQPEAALLAAFNAAKPMLESDAAAAEARANELVDAHAFLCGESGRSRLVIDGVAGFRCGSSEAAAYVAALAFAAKTKQGDVLGALSSGSQLEGPGRSVTDAVRAFAEAQLASIGDAGGYSARKIAVFREAVHPKVSLPTVGFRDDNQLLIRSARPAVIDLAAGITFSVPTEQADRRLRSPGGQHSALDVKRTCEGYTLSIFETSRLVGPVAVGAPSATPLVVADALASCPPVPEIERGDGGFHVLGWAPQGVLVARAEERRLIPLTAQGAALGAPRVLVDTAITPAPVAPGLSSADGSIYVLPSRFGILLRRPNHSEPTKLIRPEWWDPANPITELAVSPNGNRIAVVRNRTEVWVLFTEGHEVKPAPTTSHLNPNQ